MLGALALMVSVTGAATGPVGAVEERTIEGTVLDGWGNPVAGVVVFDREDPVYQAYGYSTPLAETDTAGRYAFTVSAPWARLQYSVPGTYRLRYEHPRMASVDRDVDVVAESQTVDVDATYLHQAEGPGGPVSVGSSDDIVEVELRSSAPAPGTPGQAGRSCGWVEVDGAAPVAATFEAVDGSVARFDWSHVVAQGTPDGTYAFTTWTADCADPDLRLSAVDAGAYQVLTRPMAIVETAPGGFTGPSWIELAFRTTHAMAASTVVLDGVVRTERAPSSAWEVRVPLMNLADGTHTATVSGVDRNGEVAPARTFTWTVDGTGPVLTGGSPRGTIANRVQDVTVWAHDDLAGLDPSGAELRLTTPRGDTQSFGFTHDGAGRFRSDPLPYLVDGRYQAVVSFPDQLGNRSMLTWTFEVRGLSFLQLS
jgi:hypothetical protein